MKKSRIACLWSLLLAALVACSINPATGQRQFNLYNDPQQEISLGEQAAPQFLSQYGGEIPSQEIQQYVTQLGQRLAAVSERPDLPWEFHVVNSSVINAFALPGGKIFISRGLLAKLENEAQLAGILGHEIGHVTAQHIGQQMSRQMALQVGLAAVGVAAQASEEDWLQVLGAAGGIGGNLYLLNFGRDQENQADLLGLRYMSELGYNPVAQARVMEILREASQGAGQPPEFLSTHPLPETRIKKIKELVQEKYPAYDDPTAYTFGHDDFQENVIQPLRNLPPAEHTGQSQPTAAGE